MKTTEDVMMNESETKVVDTVVEVLTKYVKCEIKIKKNGGKLEIDVYGVTEETLKDLES